MRKSKKRVIAIITCCFVLCTLCVGVFADETEEEFNYYNRDGLVMTTEPYDFGELVYSVNNQTPDGGLEGSYIVKITIISLPHASQSMVTDNNEYYLSYYDNQLRYVYNDNHDSVSIDVNIGDVIYVYCTYEFIKPSYTSPNVNGRYISVEYYSIRSNTDINTSIYSNSQDVHSSLVSVINEATNVITTNDVVMMFCILIPVISFGVGILIRLRKRS